MTSTINDGGPAFPRPAAEHSQGGHFEQSGMSLRDWFAGQALIAIICVTSAGLHQPFVDGRVARGTERARGVANDAYDVADAMLAAREEDR